MKYKHVNQGRGNIRIYDSKGIGHNLSPGDVVVIDKISEGNGVVMVEKIKIRKRKKHDSKTIGDD